MPEVGAAVVSSNSGQRLVACVKALTEQGVREIVVIDNRSNDNSVASLNENFPNVPVITLPHQLGFGPAMNRAVNELTNEYVLCLDGRAVVTRGTVDRLIKTLVDDDNVAAVGPEVGGYVSGAAMAIRRSTFVSVGGYDERTFMYAEDEDLARRLRADGWEINADPEASVEIVGRPDRPTVKMIFNHHRSLYRYYSKTTHGLGRLTLPFIALGLAVRFPVACVYQSRQTTLNLSQPEQSRQTH